MTDNKEALGTSQDAQATSEPFPAPPTPEQIAEWEAEREARSEAELAPYKAFAARQKANTETIAEHDDLMAEMPYEMTISAIGGEEESNDGV